MKIGIPRALVYYYFFPLWKTLFEELGFEVVMSDKTSKSLIDKGIKVSVPEICVPIKIMSGHLINLLEKKVDYVFLPRFESLNKGEHLCPKFIGLPDMMRYTIPGLQEKLLFPAINTDRENMGCYGNYKSMFKKLEVSDERAKEALNTAYDEWKRFRSICFMGYTAAEALEIYENKGSVNIEPPKHEGDITIGILGYVYNVYDEFVSMDIVKKMRELGVNIITFEMIKNEAIEKELKAFKKSFFWAFTNKLLGSAYNFYKNENVDGLIHMTAFNCGPDSFLGKLLELDSSNYGKPVMTVRVDEHTGENHLQTRVEAFVDMIRRKKLSERAGVS